MTRHLALVGPTASGKSALALALARELDDIEVVSVDSMQVYRGMDIGTAKPTAAEQAEVPHHLIDLCEPGERFTVAAFQQAAVEVLDAIEARGHRALLVGGTGLYLQAVIDGFTVPGEFPDVRAALEAESDEGLADRLALLDPAAAGRIEPGNRRRLLRALEVTIGSGAPFSSFGPGVDSYPATTRFRVAGLWLPRAVVNERIERRVAAMVEAGVVDEVRRLAPVLNDTARQALGYKEVLAHLEGGEPLDACLAETVRRTRSFSRRQRVWFRRDPRITWWGAEEDSAPVLPALLGEWRTP